MEIKTSVTMGECVARNEKAFRMGMKYKLDEIRVKIEELIEQYSNTDITDDELIEGLKECIE